LQEDVGNEFSPPYWRLLEGHYGSQHPPRQWFRLLDYTSKCGGARNAHTLWKRGGAQHKQRAGGLMAAVSASEQTVAHEVHITATTLATERRLL
jgi:hypothetical protein